MEKLRLSHTILYSKGWYVKNKEQWKDLVKTLAADGLITLSNEHEVAAYMLNYISSHYEVIKKGINCLSIAYMFDDGTITDLKIEYSKNDLPKKAEAIFNPEKGSLDLVTTVFIPFSDEKGIIDDTKERKLVYIHLTKNNTSLLKSFLKGREDYYNR